MDTRLKITSIVVFLIGVHLVIPKIADVSKALNPMTVSHPLTTIQVDAQVWKEVSFSAQSNSAYQLYNYGSPDSLYGSGTR
ncbi:hypothetical protein [Iningainema tapete]|uniref:Uncharacterized protein n=1 Tax=Iningainema tapete BLCC-T55 TaxID=2748662 RepID=A0A8J7C6R4_9CYAN|nr:hypothetical protein [Iningainema tapete]MBD2774674.1 hypothetical protein [Iningainema tapete BLCC-T55]